MKKNRFTLIEVLIVVMIVVLLFSVFMGVYQDYKRPSFESELNVTIKEKYVDTESEGKRSRDSHYMVSTDQGIFEVDNISSLEIWNADEIYSKLEKDKSYRVKTVGEKILNSWKQQYPYIIEVLEGPIESKNKVVETSVPVVNISSNSKSIDDMTIKELAEWAKVHGVDIQITPVKNEVPVEK